MSVPTSNVKATEYPLTAAYGPVICQVVMMPDYERIGSDATVSSESGGLVRNH